MAAHGLGADHALSVIAGLRPGAVAVVVALVERMAALLADANLARFALLAVFRPGALHGAVAVAALLAREALRLAVRARAFALAVAEGLVLAGLPGRRRAAVGERGRVHAFEAVVAVEVLGA